MFSNKQRICSQHNFLGPWIGFNCDVTNVVNGFALPMNWPKMFLTFSGKIDDLSYYVYFLDIFISSMKFSKITKLFWHLDFDFRLNSFHVKVFTLLRLCERRFKLKWSEFNYQMEHWKDWIMEVICEGITAVKEGLLAIYQLIVILISLITLIDIFSRAKY